MKKIVFAFLALVFSVSIAKAQPVSDNAVIPIGVTLNQILRIEIVNGGNMEFVFSSFDQYENGIGFGAGINTYVTKYRVSSSTKWTLKIASDVANMVGESTSNNLSVDVIEYTFLSAPLNTTNNASSYNTLSNTFFDALTDDGGTGNQGRDIEGSIRWRCGVTNSVYGATPDRYACNVFLQLEATP